MFIVVPLVLCAEGVRIASSNTIESLMEEDFKLLVNDREFLVQTPELREKLSKVIRYVLLYIAVQTL